MITLRRKALINPATPEFDRLPDAALVSFIPLEAVWASGLDVSRHRTKGEVAAGYTRFLEGDILVPKITPTFQADRTTIASGIEGGVGAGTTELHVVRVGPQAEPRYVRYLLSSRPFLHGGEARMIGVAGQKRVPDEWLRDLSVPVVSLSKQRAIADFLETETARIDALITKKRRLANVLSERFLETVRARVTGDSLASDPLHVDEAAAPSGWRCLRLGRSLTFGSGTTPLASDERFYGSGTAWIVTGDLCDDEIAHVSRSVTDKALFEYSALRIHPAGALVVAMYGATVGRLGITTYPAAVNQACCVVRPSQDVQIFFLFFYLLAYRPALLELSMGAGQPNISQETLRSIQIAVPPQGVAVAHNPGSAGSGPSADTRRRRGIG